MTEERAQAAADPVLPVYVTIAAFVSFVGWDVAGWVGVASAIVAMLLISMVWIAMSIAPTRL